ncbi:MAG: NAD(P)/FAD-dependent oxidoreductase [Burkholderiales bacterium]|nr:NAD(P)/FAD-dependent oxidoreductase [Burkholderiales bacterium]
MAAAVAAAGLASSVILVDENCYPGGQIWRGGTKRWHDERLHALWKRLSACKNVRIIQSARVIAAPDKQTLLLETSAGAQLVHWEKLILCSGARELLLPFPGWTLPGVTGAGGLQAMIKGGMDVRGKRVVVAGTGPLLLAVAESVLNAGGNVIGILEHRGTRQLAGFSWQLLNKFKAKWRQSLQLLWALKSVRYRHNATVLAADGEDRLRSVSIRHAGHQLNLKCDLLACAYGLIPNLELASLLGCKTSDGRVIVDARQATSRPKVWAAGEATGIGGVDKALAEGRIAGLAAVGAAPSHSEFAARSEALQFADLLARYFAPASALRAVCTPDTLVCRCEDVYARQLSEFKDWRTAKLMTRAGMGACQGRICGAACQFLYDWQAPELRQPVFPATTSTLAALSAACKKDEKE